MQKPALTLITCLFGLSLAGCAGFKGAPDNESTLDTEQTEAQTKTTGKPETGTDRPIEYAEFEPEVLYLLLAGEIAAQRGRYDVVLVNYLQAAKQSRDVGVIKRTLRIAQSLNADNAQSQLARLWLDVDPENLEAHRVLAIQAVKQNNLEAALGHMETIMDLGGDADFDSLAAMAGNLPVEKQQELLALYLQLEQRHPDNPELQFSIALLMKVTGDPQQALAQLEPLLEQNPNFQPALVLKGDLLYEVGQKTEALAHLQRNTRRFPDNRQMGTLYGRMLIGEDELRLAQDEFRRLVAQFPDVPGLRLSHALVALENDETALAEAELTRLIEQGHHTDEAHYYLGRIADQSDRTEQAIGYYQNVESGNYYFPALARASELKAENGDLDGALADIQTLREGNPEQAENFWLLEVNLLIDNDRQSQALARANAALEAHPDNIQLRYARAMQLDSSGRFQDAEEDLRHILETEPDNAVALNALGYIITTRSNRYDEARALIEQALAQDPENPAILDSMGWVLFKQGDSERALDYLTRAWEAYPDPEVAAHLGEVLWQTGDQSQARMIWEQGLESDPEHPILQETIERVTGEPAR
ncbi:tetratricopeptide repeat protein [Marinobacter confluentis]|uniref:Tetratricopeptide repeat protein n=1 Tax=Marinobacter confluentis TaxID=1697557 RepID=A0A4Z1BED1_9GAMM|nr:tetratricopeptide repeat protein [Marinobacter confluentis]TGN40984.1 tetratricopeptide repeat protein [Marinobacter confluentis]